MQRIKNKKKRERIIEMNIQEEMQIYIRQTKKKINLDKRIGKQ